MTSTPAPAPHFPLCDDTATAVERGPLSAVSDGAADGKVGDLVRALQQAGASVHTIAAALNSAGTVAPSGLRWTPKSVGRRMSGRAKPRPVAAPVAAAHRERPSASRHEAHVYADEADLVHHASVYLAEALYRGADCVVVTDRASRSSIRRALTAFGLDASLSGSRYVEVDAELLLAEFMRDGRPDAALLEQVVAPLLGRESGATPLHAYGDMVDVLWRTGNVAGALELEDLWNDLQQRLGFERLCGYSVVSLRAGSSAEIGRLRAGHTQLSGLQDLAS
jgi:hypothetical protein